MAHRNILTLAALLAGGILAASGQSPFCGAVGTEGCNAIAADSPRIAAWATGCTVVRGPVDIADPEGEKVRFGTESAGIGLASSLTTDAVSLGDGGSATLTFAAPIRNIPGPDFAVFENSFNDSFLELAFVEVSTDGIRFVRFPATSLTQTETQVGPIGTLDPTLLNNLAGKFRIGYGTPFDLDELRDSAGINIDSICYVRVVDVVGTIDPRYATRDAYGHIVNDPYPTSDVVYASGGFDLTGVAVLTTLSGISSATTAPLTLHPNPAGQWLTVGGLTPGIPLRLYSLGGQLLRQATSAGTTTSLFVGDLPRGTYLLQAAEQSRKVVKL
ncbi:MAG: T9SS type A sorting domain-containing protein [Bacteroidales bacterium]|nr:T9SS type A sorting domain-containing protein [Bacteroidales bacterium]